MAWLVIVSTSLNGLLYIPDAEKKKCHLCAIRQKQSVPKLEARFETLLGVFFLLSMRI